MREVLLSFRHQLLLGSTKVESIRVWGFITTHLRELKIIGIDLS